MARVTGGIMAISGKIGQIVGYSRYGRNFVRSMPQRTSFKPSPEQLNNRKALASVQQWLQPITAFVRVGFKNYSSTQHGFGNALSYLKRNAMNEAFEVDASRAMISWGDLPEPLSPVADNSTPGVLELTWQPVPGHGTDHAIILAYSKYGDYAGELCGARRDTGKHTLLCPRMSGKEVDVYLGFITEERERCSNSVYLGKVKIS